MRPEKEGRERLLVLLWLFLFQFNHRFNSTGWKFVLRLLMRRSSISPLSSSLNNLESDVKCDQIMLVKPHKFSFDSSPQTIFIQISIEADREDLVSIVALFIHIVLLFILFFYILYGIKLRKRDFIQRIFRKLILRQIGRNLLYCEVISISLHQWLNKCLKFRIDFSKV